MAILTDLFKFWRTSETSCLVLIISFLVLKNPGSTYPELAFHFLFYDHEHLKTGICAIFYLKTVMLLTKLYIVKKKQEKKTSDKLFEKQQNHQCLPLRYV